VGAGVELVATQNDLLVQNKVHDNGAWGIAMYDYPDSETPPAEAVSQGQACRGGNLNPAVGPLGSNPVQAVCYYPSVGNNTVENSLYRNGSFGNPTNGDIGNGGTYTPYNCFSGNTDGASAATVWPPTDGSGCNPGDNTVLSGQLVCDSGIFGAVTSGSPLQSVTTCPSAPTINYPKLSQSTCGSADSPGTWQGDPQNGACMMSMAASLSQTTMPNPCAGAPANAYCVSAASTTPTILPNTSGRGLPVPPPSWALLLLLGAGLPLAVGLSRRRH
jgi:hypothetical protein